MTDSPWFKLYPGDFLNGLVGLDPDEIAVYTVAVLMIYDSGGPIRDTKVLARRVAMRPSKCERVLLRLVDLGKMTQSEAGFSNGRCEKELENRRNLSEISAKKAHERWSKQAEKHNENNETAMPVHPSGIDPAYAYQKPEARSQIDRQQQQELCDPPAEPVVVVGSGSLDAKQAVAKAMGFEWRDAKLTLDFGRVDQWLADGYDAALICETVERVMAQRSGNPPRRLTYFDQALADARAARTAPMPAPRPSASAFIRRGAATDQIITRKGEPDIYGRKPRTLGYGTKWAI